MAEVVVVDAAQDPRFGTRNAWRAAAIIMALSLVLAALTWFDAVHAALTGLLEAGNAVIARYPRLGPWLFVVFAAFSAMLAFLSTAVLLPLATLTWGEPLTMLLLWSGWLLGGICSYAIGRYLGRAALRRLAPEAGLRRIEQLLGPSLPFGMLLLVLMALPSEIPGYVLGAVRFSLRRYLFALALVEIPYAVLAVHMGASFVAQRTGMIIVLGGIAALAGVAALYLLRRRIPGSDRSLQ